MESFSLISGVTTQPALPQHMLAAPGEIGACIEKVIAYIENHLHEPLSLSDLAGSGGFSVYYFARRFKQSTGLSPKQYVLRKRLECAYRLLCQGQVTVSEVAHQTGFTDQSHLVRYFKKCWGQTPRQVLDADTACPLFIQAHDPEQGRDVRPCQHKAKVLPEAPCLYAEPPFALA